MGLSKKSLPSAITFGALVAVGSWSFATGPAVAQGAACLNPRGVVQQTICLDPQLADLSQEMRQAVRVVIRALPRSLRPQMLRDQRDWSLTRNRCARAQDPRQCLRIVYEDRIAELGETLAGPVGGARPRRGQPSIDPDFSNRVLARPPQPAPRTTDRTAIRAPVEQRRLPQLAPQPTGPGQEPAVVTTTPEQPATQAPAPVEPAAPPETQVTRAAPETSDDDKEASSEPGERPAGKIADTLSSGVWRAEITSGIRPGTIYIFHRNGVLLTADCVQAYRLGSWKIASNGEVVLASGQGKALRGRVIKLRDRFVRMQIKKKSGAILRTLVLRPAANPFDCTPNRE